ncbi:hypothetical protein [Sphingomonas sp. MM-1]|uniref:hypothetical protein n=1 Tax=Sphingomonas sp. MM-1 TaxID=745310 RepID=UPI0011833744|nr:hypothetical protein [Sphingomonas sp. MM-1]
MADIPPEIREAALDLSKSLAVPIDIYKSYATAGGNDFINIYIGWEEARQLLPWVLAAGPGYVGTKILKNLIERHIINPISEEGGLIDRRFNKLLSLIRKSKVWDSWPWRLAIGLRGYNRRDDPFYGDWNIIGNGDELQDIHLSIIGVAVFGKSLEKLRDEFISSSQLGEEKTVYGRFSIKDGDICAQVYIGNNIVDMTIATDGKILCQVRPR